MSTFSDQSPAGGYAPEVLSANDGRMLVRWPNGNAASFTDGHWVPAEEFDFHDLHEHFAPVLDEKLKAHAALLAQQCLRAH